MIIREGVDISVIFSRIEQSFLGDFMIILWGFSIFTVVHFPLGLGNWLCHPKPVLASLTHKMVYQSDKRNGSGIGGGLGMGIGGGSG